MPELAHLAVVVGDERHRARTEAEGLVRTFNELHAAEYLDRLRRGEAGAAAAYLGGLRRNSGVDPWVLLEVVAARALVASEPGSGVAGPEPVQAAAMVAAPERREDGQGGAG
jgi:hypothetical protein